METILQFLATNVTSSVIGHYVRKGLIRIDKGFAILLKRNADISEIKDFVLKKSLEKEIMNFADEVKRKIENTKNDNVINFTGGVNEGIVANNVEIKSIKKKVNIVPPQGTIASDAIRKNYIKYLIDRYHEFKKAEVGEEKMKYPVFYKTINREFGAKWDMIPLKRFSNLSSYIQNRIDNTILGKNKKSKNVKRYSSYEEYIDKHGD